MNKYICIHGHFYQPPRENPWLEAVELQDSAYPFHDWNQRISLECYAANGFARILNNERKIIDIVNNYKKVSFNFGPTLLNWLKNNAPGAYQAILDADKQSQKSFSGHGSAIAQCYNHIIMPLANAQDKRTQIIWGIKDFQSHFKRPPEGMWLPETAVDLETLDIMAELGIKFTILSPYQARRIRRIGEEKWEDVSRQNIDSTVAYLCKLPSGRSMALFFYNGLISTDIAFGNLLENGEFFAKRLVSLFSNDDKAQLVNVATDGETFGHHHRFGEMALSYCLYFLELNKLAGITVFGEYLDNYPCAYEVEIIENSSWSCFHGVERWRSNCGCNIGTDNKWDQEWRKTLRFSMDWLRDNLIEIYQKYMKHFVSDPWLVRDEYIDVILGRSFETAEKFIKKHSKQSLSSEDKIKFLKLLEIERNAMLMYTSCGWFFDDISRIETRQILEYAARAMQLACEISGKSLEDDFIEHLKDAKSNDMKFKNGAYIYKMLVKPAIIGLTNVGIHYAIYSIFKEFDKNSKVYCYEVEQVSYEKMRLEERILSIGKVRIRSNITWQEGIFNFAVLYLGNKNLVAAIEEEEKRDSFKEKHIQIKQAFLNNEISKAQRLIREGYQEHNFSLQHLFKDEKSEISKEFLNYDIRDMQAYLKKVYKNNDSLKDNIKDSNLPLPKSFGLVYEFLINLDIVDAIEEEELNFEKIKSFIEESLKYPSFLNKKTLAQSINKRIESLMKGFKEKPQDSSILERASMLLAIVAPLSLDLNLWEAQNIYFDIGKKLYNNMQAKANREQLQAQDWIRHFDNLGELILVKVNNSL